MKKLVFTVAAVAALSLTNNAQNDPKKKDVKETEKKEAVKPENATATKDGGTVTKGTEEPKKSGTRMAINEKGLPGEKKTKSTNNPK